MVAIVLLVMKKFLRTEEVFRSLTLSSRRLLENYHDDAESSGSESDDGFQGVDLEVASVRQLCSDAFQRRVLSVRAVLRLRISRTDEISKRTHLRLAASRKTVVFYCLLGLGGARRGSTGQGRSQKFVSEGDKTGGLGTEVTQRVQGQSPGGDLGAKPPDANNNCNVLTKKP